ncbi:MAG: UDP-3-O-(3-hydroxymyristoyl)glucosamine N-acyltransferase [Gammaproteobacteria bacterium]|nr:UDP-3-O-(3-hydroxymyristoyl)glucosamine N-acyltransferase [Gammaproteobacteria bacterium]
MGCLLKNKIKASQIAEHLNLTMYGHDIEINAISSLTDVKKNSLFFAKDQKALNNVLPQAVVIAPEETAQVHLATIKSTQPRLDFIRALLFIKDKVGFVVSEVNPQIHPSVKIGQNVVIEKGVVIGEGCVIDHNVVIRQGTEIGKYCHIQSGAVIGEEGFGYERDEQNIPIKMLHLGGVKIKNNVHIGANTSVCQGALEPTIIEDNVKIDNLVHIAHNCHIKSRVIITACAEVSGGVVVEEDAWIAPQAAIRQKLIIGSASLVGLGAVVVKNVLKNTVVMGNPAKAKE